MKRIVVFIVFVVLAIFIDSSAFAKEDLDQVPGMSGKIEIMDQLGLIEHENPAPRLHFKKSQKTQKQAPAKVRMNNLAGMTSDAE